ncbi:MAG: hypothetical protein GX617_03395 [Lentisphaerae bacterium]|nr:hypothetical protein [Lentisphaerota bacterium]
MNEIVKVFNDRPVRIINLDGEQWFVGKDVCNLLGYRNDAGAMNRHCKGVVKRYPLQTAARGGVRPRRGLRLGKEQPTNEQALLWGGKIPPHSNSRRWAEYIDC